MVQESFFEAKPELLPHLQITFLAWQGWNFSVHYTMPDVMLTLRARFWKLKALFVCHINTRDPTLCLLFECYTGSVLYAHQPTWFPMYIYAGGESNATTSLACVSSLADICHVTTWQQSSCPWNALLGKFTSLKTSWIHFFLNCT